MTKQSRFIIILLIAVVGVVVAYNYVYKDHRNIASEESQMEISAKALLDLFKNGEGELLLNSTITVTGGVSDFEVLQLTLDESVHCTFSEANNTKITKNELVKVKGRCIGYDDLFEIVKLDQCTLTK